MFVDNVIIINVVCLLLQLLSKWVDWWFSKYNFNRFVYHQVEILCPINSQDPVDYIRDGVDLWDTRNLEPINQEYLHSRQIPISNKYVPVQWILKCDCVSIMFFFFLYFILSIFDLHLNKFLGVKVAVCIGYSYLHEIFYLPLMWGIV